VSERRSINELNADLFRPEEVDRYADPREIGRKAMDYLARREYGRDELVMKLTNAGFLRERVEVEVDRLAAEGLQNDERYAESFVQSRIGQGKGPVRIRLELKERGLGPAAIEAALQTTSQDWVELAVTVRQGKFGAALPANFAEKARQMRFLQYRGFDTDQVQAAVRPRGDQ